MSTLNTTIFIDIDNSTPEVKCQILTKVVEDGKDKVINHESHLKLEGMESFEDFWDRVGTEVGIHASKHGTLFGS